MILLKQNSANEFVIYANTISNDLQDFGDYFLIGFQNGFTKEWSYVVPYVLTRNTRFIKLQIDIVPSFPEEDPLNNVIYLSPSMNWDYKIWNTENPTLDPAFGTLIDNGQMMLENQVPSEVPFVSYESPNDTLKAYVYYTANGIWNNTSNLWNYFQSVWGKDYRPKPVPNNSLWMTEEDTWQNENDLF